MRRRNLEVGGWCAFGDRLGIEILMDVKGS
jgi:hypothetical protein